ncbi:gp436 family protein [Lonepinella koalarum]|uniref:gp436 family protein n=1 Tax=Lonepinella koalarum TaxID=53417 RepID=UPI003F6E29BB
MYIQADELLEVMSQRNLIELTKDESRATEINLAVAEKACIHACEIVDGYLRSRYLTPLNTVPTIVRNIALQLARFWLYSRRPEGSKFPDNVKDTHAQALKDLERIQNGKLHLGLPTLADGNDDHVLGEAKFQTRSKPKMDLTGY